MDTILNTADQQTVEELRQLLDKLTPDEQRAALAYFQGVQLGQTYADPKAG